jgi:hypothetical protein
MTPNGITLLFKEARDSFPPIEGKLTDDNLLLIREMLLPILMEIPYNQLGGIHSITAILMDTVMYAADHGSNAFKCPVRLLLYDGSIADEATTVHRIRAEAAHKAHLDNYASYKAAERGASKFLQETLTRSGSKTSRTLTPSTRRCRPLKLSPSLMPTAGDFMPLT